MNAELENHFKQMEKIQSKMKIQMDDVWGTHDEKTFKTLTNGMIVARSEEKCPIFKDKVPHKSVTVVCTPEQEDEVYYWLEYVHGGGSVSKRKRIKGVNQVALRSNYMYW